MEEKIPAVKPVFQITKWEYRIINSENDIEERLNKLGQQGWELVAVNPPSAYLKRNLGSYRE